MTNISFKRRGFALAAVAAAAMLQMPRRAEAAPEDLLRHVADEAPPLCRRISGLQARDWREHFETLRGDAILCDTIDRVLHYWAEDGFYRIYPTSVPMSDELTRRGAHRSDAEAPRAGMAPDAEHAGAQP